jgi:glucan phosphoethanolaminetransferase (alkaline phosphatase superfamily)
MKIIKIVFIVFLSINTLMQGFFGVLLTFNTKSAIQMFNPAITEVAGALLQNSVLLGSALLFSAVLLVTSIARLKSNEKEASFVAILTSSWTFSLGPIGLFVLGTPQFLLFDSIRAAIPLVLGIIIYRSSK